ncbi:ABC transporter permease [Bradyrhizobium sp. CCBAU 53340]|uniref:ABC transporter permease n=1 Tax=Bradyrhizobium sp. CCBAU 53340 TaxID=1325112 RepID=UPI00188A8C9C|nr:ABC transporter permease [Bradyrhizobium sp. CCBAU 53340]QOZ44724.1 ABC transporter permease [Bradyrhizobium sp. CCBAU 53340]
MKRTIVYYAPLLVIALIWEGVSRAGLVSTDILPPLSTVIVSLIELVRDGELPSNAFASLERAGSGLALAIAFGGSLGILMAWSRGLNAIINPLVQIFYPVPKSALIPVTSIWLGFGDASKVLLVFLGCMLPITIGAYNGARSSDAVLVWSARSMGSSRLGVLFDVVAPSALPELLNGVRTALALSFVLLVAGELISGRDGLGYLIGFYGAAGSYAPMYAVIVTVALLGFGFDRMYQMFTRRLLLWRE